MNHQFGNFEDSVKNIENLRITHQICVDPRRNTKKYQINLNGAICNCPIKNMTGLIYCYVLDRLRYKK